MTEESPIIASEEKAPKITSVKKDKDPKRVQAGKRLAAISKTARENKMRKKIEAEKSQESWNINYPIVFGAIGAIAAPGGLYYRRSEYIRETQKLESVKEEKELEPVHIVTKEKTPKLDSL